MRRELVKFVSENSLSPFSLGKSSVGKVGSIYRTKDAKAVHRKVLAKLSGGFVFSESSNVWNCFGIDSSLKEVYARQEFFKKLGVGNWELGDVLGRLSKPRASWKPRYDVVVVTEDESTFVRLNKLSCGVVLLTSQNDVAELERYDVVQVVDCDDFRGMLERLPQSVFLNSVEDVYLERFLESLSGWRENFALLNGADVSCELREVLDLLIEPFALLENKEGKIITEGEVEAALEDINEEVGEGIKGMMISGEVMLKMLGEGKMSDEILVLVREAIERSGVPEHIFNLGVPVSVDYKELEAQIRIASANEFSDVAERIKRNASKLRGIPKILQRLEAEIVVEDFCNGVAKYVDGLAPKGVPPAQMASADTDKVGKDMTMPKDGTSLLLEDGLNLFLRDAQPVSFVLDDEARCSILTGANSGGKTTLLEHMLQNVSLFRMGLPVVGSIFECPVFDEVYYFAKTKGSTSKGAFETLLTQMSGIKSGNNTLILADEIEAVTEPGVAGKIIGATAEYFVRKGCFIILATHLGAEIAKNLPKGARVDGIEASGLDEDFNLIVNHNPVLGRLASSTPELIVERMASSIGGEYFEFLFEKVKK
ncbi:hypothetical protein HN903_01740 [archaeon]|nr:hypothetical protein [archaeon]MBT7128455.1 hypothetical protein [archaeon]